MIPKTVHGFYYTQKGDDLCGLPLPKVCQEIMTHAVRAGIGPLSAEDYWLKLGRYMMTHCPQGYLGWEGDSYWLIYCGENIAKPKENVGVQLVRFKADGTLGYRWLNAPDFRKFKDPDLEDEGDDLGSGLYRFAYTPWDWLLDGEGDDEMFRLTPGLKKAIEANTAWTNPVHAAMAKKYPPEKYWK